MKTNLDRIYLGDPARLESLDIRTGREPQPRETGDRWQFITSAKAWRLSEKSGKMAPYAGYMIELKDGRKLRCRRDAHKTIFEITS